MTTQSLKEDGRPAQQWYWDDWFSAFDVRLCSLAARGLWIDMLGIMFKAEIRGTLTINGKQVSSKSLAKVSGETEQNINKYLEELEDNDVFSQLNDGTIICRRVFNESKKKEEISKIRAEAGRKGAEERWQKNGKEDKNNIAKMAASSSTASPIVSSTSKECPKLTYSDAHFKIAKLLEQKIKERIPKHKFKGNYIENWANTVRIMDEKEKEPNLKEIKILIIWVSKHHFWYKNILSMDKLREQFGRLWAEMEEKQPTRDPVGQSQIKNTPKEEKAQDEYLKMRLKYEEKLTSEGLQRDSEPFRDRMAIWTEGYYEKKDKKN